MLRHLVGFSLRFRGVVIALACAIGAYGVWVTKHARLDVFPEFTPPQVVVQTEAPGLSPEEVETLVTRPIENAINGAGGVESIRSQSIQGLSGITVTFADGTEILKARQQVGERLSEAAGQMPAGVKAPAMAPQTSAASVMLTIGLTSGTRSLRDQRTFADWVLKPRLLGVPGVAKVAVFGGEVRQLQIQVLPDRLAALGLSLDDVVEAAQKVTGVRGSGFIETENQRIVLRTEGAPVSPDELGAIVVPRRGGAGVLLKDVANVREASEPRFGDASVEGTPGVVLVVSSQYGANTMEVTRAAEAALDELRPALAAERIEIHPALFRPANFIVRAIGNVAWSLAIGGALVTLVLFLFLWNLRTAFISVTAIPLSLLVAVIVLDRLGIAINTLTLGGLAIAIGEVVDDAIIDVENIFRRLRENRALADPRPVLQVVYDASLEVRSAVVYATFIVVLVFVPVLTMSGVQGRLFAPLGVAYILAILASLAVALTLTPALSLALFAAGKMGSAEPPFASALKARYRALLERVAARPRLVIGAAILLCLAAAATLPFFGGTFLPEFREGHFIVHMSAVPGTSLQESLRLGTEVTRELKKNPHIKSVSQRAGRAEQADDVFGSHYSEFDVELVPLDGEEAEFVQSEIRDALQKFPGAYFAIKPFLTERIEETISGSTAEVVVKVFGNDLDVIDGRAKAIAQTLAAIPGAADVQVQSPPGIPQLEVRLRAERLRQLGFEPVEVLDAVQTAFQGLTVTQAFDGGRVFDIAVVLDPAARRNPEDAGRLLLRNSAGSVVALDKLADIELSHGRFAVLHDGARRLQGVTCNVRGRDLASFVAEARRKVQARVPLPPGTYVVFTGAAEAQSQARRDLLVHSLLAAAGIVLLLAVVFRTLSNLLLVLCNLPFALVGGVLAVFFTGGNLSVGSLVGFVTLFGITTRNSIMMVSHFEHLVTQEGATWNLETALRGASERLVPVLMTALVTGLGLLPIAIGSGEPGREIEGPMAIVILGGLLTSTILNLLVLPTLALRYGSFESSSSNPADEASRGTPAEVSG